MNIALHQIAKRFNREWIFRNLSYNFQSGEVYAITGNNGSGKSTLLQCIAGSISLNAGKINYQLNQKEIESENVYQYISLATPYLELVEEMTALEFLNFHQHFKPFDSSFEISDILSDCQLASAATKQIRYFSSGMKQRLKLAQAFYASTPVLLLDEPCTNLDSNGIQLYHQLLEKFASKKLVIICSNDKMEYELATQILHIQDYK